MFENTGVNSFFPIGRLLQTQPMTIALQLKCGHHRTPCTSSYTRHIVVGHAGAVLRHKTSTKQSKTIQTVSSCIWTTIKGITFGQNLQRYLQSALDRCFCVCSPALASTNNWRWYVAPPLPTSLSSVCRTWLWFPNSLLANPSSNCGFFSLTVNSKWHWEFIPQPFEL